MESSKSILEELVLNESFQDYVMHNKNKTEWQDWVAQNPDKKDQFENAKSIIRSLRIKEQAVPESEIDNEITKFEQRIEYSKQSGSVNVLPLWKILSRIAAILILVGSITLIYYNVPKEPPPVSQVDMVTKETPLGAKLQIKLPDGTKVKLNAGSVLKYPSVFSNDSRAVELVGEAFFEVVTDRSRPFIVSTPYLQTRVLGTSFTIKSFTSEISKVSLMEGSIRVSADGSDQLLEPGEQVILKNKSMVVQPYDYNEEFGWRDGILNFKDDNAEKVFNKLKLWYGVDFDFGEQKIPVLKYSGYYKNEDLETVLEGLSYSLKFDYEISDRTIKIMFN
ncbi:FecR domain-containing protein [Fulvivirgaceae bacterium BMA12]|uniref:FecR domain-containing protein n=1 Tax=Agaribacillus aureus TaxID=3051825 RepID=A0ABT8L4W1_9BACT|nr:FecR domain-containing protein [Fulvivirgaceae bacterium BMA12]